MSDFIYFDNQEELENLLNNAETAVLEDLLERALLEHEYKENYDKDCSFSQHEIESIANEINQRA